MNFFKKLLCFSQKEQKSENVYSHENEDPEEIIFAELPFPLEQEDLIIGILNQIACEKNKPVEKIKKLLLIKQDPKINKRFWQILDAIKPGHPYNYVGCCAECGSLELREQLP